MQEVDLAAFSLIRGLGDGPSLLHPGRGSAWWVLADGSIAWTDSRRLWHERGDQVIVEPGRTEPDRGGDWTVERRGAGWTVRDRSGEIAAPGDALRCDPRPWPVGRGLVWADDRLLFRWDGRSIRAIATLRDRQRFAVGPHGAVLIGDRNRWTRVASPGGDAQPLASPVPVSPWSVRWSADGLRLATIDDQGRGLTVEVRTGAVHELPLGLMPVDAEGGTLSEAGVLEARGVRRVGLREASCAFDGRLLAGPGGVVWDLAQGAVCFAEPIVPLGVVVPSPADWLALAWDTGLGGWFDPHTGARTVAVAVPLAPDDSIAGGRWIHGAAFVTTSGGQVLRIEGADALPVDSDLDEVVPQTAGDGWSIDRGGLHVAGAADLDVPVEAGARVGARVYAWSDDGLLIAVPVA